MLTWLASRLDGELASDESLEFYPAMAWRSGDGWKLWVRGCVFEASSVPGVERLARRWLKVDPDDAESRGRLRERLAPFLVDKERGKRFRLEASGFGRAFRVTGANGHFGGVFRVSDAEWAGFPERGVGRVRVRFGTRRSMRDVELEVHVMARGGWSVASDIDDTVKETGLADRREAVLNTFVRPFKAVPGMAAAYAAWGRALGADWHYVTGSPWQLWGPLSRFVADAGLPSGTWHMQEFRAKDRSLLRLFRSPMEYKAGVLRQLLRMDPERRWILVGDSGQSDPEAYGRIAAEFPGRVAWVWIRRLDGVGADAGRYERAFRSGSLGGWGLFEDGNEIAGWRP